MIEIEKKFLLTDAQIQQLVAGARELERKHVEDVYLDTDDFDLTSRDYWFRRRDGVYELKAPLASGGADAVTNRYNEMADLDGIRAELQLGDQADFEGALAQAGIKPSITCITDRTSYDLDGFHIDIDTASFPESDFTYSIVEIELLIENESEADVAEGKIIELAQRFGLATDQVVHGKVVAYLRDERPMHYEALVSAGVIKG